MQAHKLFFYYLMKTKYETKEALCRFFILIHNQFNVTVKTILRDIGNEFSWTNFYVSLGIIHQTICIGTNKCQ